MVDLVIRPAGAESGKRWVLQLRRHESLGEVEYTTICYMTDELAKDIIEAGKPYWLFGEPKPRSPVVPQDHR